MNAGHIMLALSNPISPEVDDGFNEWYRVVHGPELLKQVAGFQSMTRFRAVAQAHPSGAEFPYRYMTAYEIGNGVDCMRALAEAVPHMTPPPPIVNMNRSFVTLYEKFYSTGQDWREE
ncbi:hypothetical protein SAMN02927924_01137 [Sphingobium faniae]|nr:hypothetical protein SAMN02927924_01137 [Sphingobium faniae]